ncbi:hypothetical protein KC973_01620 [Candidatus Saccharibacteria bacterium]|nr:hypothetical protein [Candidatus Saccharibacteria bacterium]
MTQQTEVGESQKELVAWIKKAMYGEVVVRGDIMELDRPAGTVSFMLITQAEDDYGTAMIIAKYIRAHVHRVDAGELTVMASSNPEEWDKKLLTLTEFWHDEPLLTEHGLRKVGVRQGEEYLPPMAEVDPDCLTATQYLLRMQGALEDLYAKRYRWSVDLDEHFALQRLIQRLDTMIRQSNDKLRRLLS